MHIVDTHGLTPVALAAEGDFISLRVSAPSDSRERSAFTHGLTPVVLSGALIDQDSHRRDTKAQGGMEDWGRLESGREVVGPP
jgi:hypothetical protein